MHKLLFMTFLNYTVILMNINVIEVNSEYKLVTINIKWCIVEMLNLEIKCQICFFLYENAFTKETKYEWKESTFRSIF